jgi:CheY-like chemotaxis protein
MTANTLKQGTAKELKKLFAMLLGSMGETLGPLIHKPISVRPAEPEVKDVERLLADLQRPCACVRGVLDKGFAGKTLAALIEIPDAVAMTGALMMTPEDVVAGRRSRCAFEGEDAEALGELGKVLFAGLAAVLREHANDVGVRYQDHGAVAPGVDKQGGLGSGALFVHGFRLKIGEFPESTGALVVDRATAEAWNKAPLELAAVDAPVPNNATPAATAPSSATATAAAARSEEELLESIPAAPIRGNLDAYVLQAEPLLALRRSCRRVGLELRRHGRAEIPNPYAHKNGIVVLDVPHGEERRFDWVRRIKEMAPTARVVLLVHHPSRQRVAQAFLAKADVILGFPCDEAHLSQKLAGLLAADTEPTPTSPPAAPPAT